MTERINWEELAQQGEEIIQERMATDEWYCHLVEQNSILGGYEAGPTHQMEVVANVVQNDTGKAE